MNKEKLLILLLIVITINLSLYSDELILHLTDPDNDDHGAGYIKYPDNRMFTDGIFDITDFRITLIDEVYEFQLTFAGKILPVQHSEFEYKYDLGNEFILPLVHVYIDTDHRVDSGFSETIAGTNVQLNSESAWEKCVVIGALPARYKGYLTVKQPELARRTYFPDKIFQTSEKTKLYARISKVHNWVRLVKIGDSPFWCFLRIFLKPHKKTSISGKLTQLLLNSILAGEKVIL